MAIAISGTTGINACHLPVSSYRNTEEDEVKIQKLIAKRAEDRAFIGANS